MARGLSSVLRRWFRVRGTGNRTIADKQTAALLSPEQGPPSYGTAEQGFSGDLSGAIVLYIKHVYRSGTGLTPAEAYRLANMLSAFYGTEIKSNCAHTFYWTMVARRAHSRGIVMPPAAYIEQINV